MQANQHYTQLLQHIKSSISKSRYVAARMVNQERLDFSCQGFYVSTKKRRMGKCKIADGEFTEKYVITICDDIPK